MVDRYFYLSNSCSYNDQDSFTMAIQRQKWYFSLFYSLAWTYKNVFIL